jgi:hypothetical protein
MIWLRRWTSSSGETLGDATPYRGAREEQICIRSRTSFLIGRFIGAVTLKGDEVKVDERRWR